MVETDTWCRLVQQAQRGRQDCMSQLVHESKGRLCAYIYRVTLDHDLTEDLSQEILLQVVQSIGSLNRAERFWPWMYRIAHSKMQEYYKSKQRKKMISDTAFYKDFLLQNGKNYEEDGLRKMLHEELSKKVMTAMKQVRQQYRAVLSLRCFEQMSFADIAEAMQCNEVTARVLFFRAKKAIKKQLARQGLSKSLLLMCLGLFGKLTAPTEAAASTLTVTAASTKVGLTAAALATAGSKLGIATIAAVMTIAGIGIAVLPGTPEPQASLQAFMPDINEISSLHFTTQLQDNDPNTGGSLSKGAYEQKFYFPEGIDGPMFMRMQRWTPAQDEKLCSWLENGEGNYYYASDKNEVYIYNCRVCWSSLKVSRLPTDSQDFIDFISQVEGDLPAFKGYMRDAQTGLLTSSVDYRFVNAPNFVTEYRYNTAGPEQFQYDWPVSVPIIDQRDLMHKRGWTYFYVNGALNGKEISGRGQIPFIYDTCKTHPAWMILNIGYELEIVDCRAGAQIRRGSDAVVASYPAGTFFEGLARPWMGMHTADIIRRDAVKHHIRFCSERLENEEMVSITLEHHDANDGTSLTRQTSLIYTIDMEKDIVSEIKFVVNGAVEGAIVFSYLQDIGLVQGDFIEPAVTETPQAGIRQSPDIFWLVNLAQQNMDM